MANFGLIDVRNATNQGLRLWNINNDKRVSFKIPNINVDQHLRWISDLPLTQEILTIDSSGNFATIPLVSAGGDGTVTTFSVGANATTIFDVATPNTTPTLSYKSQAANLFLASPNGSVGSPVMRSIVYTDIASIIGSTANTIAAGNDSRFNSIHTQNTDTGTISDTFTLDSDGTTPIKLGIIGSGLSIRNNANTAYADLRLANLTVEGNFVVNGTTTTVNSEQLTVNDNRVVLNNNVTTGTPTEDGGIDLRRGDQANSTVVWKEVDKKWYAGIEGSELPLVRHKRMSFTSANLSAGILIFSHGLNNQYPDIWLVDQNQKVIKSPDDITCVDADTASIDLTSFVSLITSTWQVCANG